MFEIRTQLSRDSSGSTPWESLGSPTLLRSPTSGFPLPDGLYEDATFPKQHMPIREEFVWKRPQEICKSPQFITDGATHDCWFLSAVASLSLNPFLLHQVVPPGQGFQGGYNGCFRFRGPFGKKNDFGIVYWHAYSVTGLETIKTKGSPVQLVRIRNPWDGRCLFIVFSLPIRMSPEDFCQNFDMVEVCHLSGDALSESKVKKPWKCTLHHGHWIPQRGLPQYSLTLLEEDDPSDPEQMCSFLLALMQKHTHKTGVLSNTELRIYKVSHFCFLSVYYWICKLQSDWLDVYRFSDGYNEHFKEMMS
ncbi:hypothetical protein cypCar_00013294 [Cyprinus carpio]|nr:hypothetical protein cypCar_00013294 [Cyprinus carpio]